MLLGGMKQLAPSARDLLLRIVKRPRELLPGINLLFPDSRARYDFSREVVSFVGEALGHLVRCAVSREALEDHLGANGQDKEGCLASFQHSRSRIERMVKTKWPVEEPETVLLKTSDVEELQKIP